MSRWEELAAITCILLAISASWVAAMQWMLGRTVKHFDKRFNEIASAQKQGDMKVDRLEKDILKWQRDVAEKYVRQEDQTRVMSQLTIRIDSVLRSFVELRDSIRGSRSQAE